MPYKDPAIRRECYRLAGIRWRAKNRAVVAEHGRRRYADPVQRELKHKADRLWHSAHRESVKLKMHDWWLKMKNDTEHKAKRGAWGRAALLKKYGLTENQFAELLERQNYKCQICRKKFDRSVAALRPCVDHCHNGGHVRALLCTKCNSAIAMLGHSASLAIKAADYLASGALFNGH